MHTAVEGQSAVNSALARTAAGTSLRSTRAYPSRAKSRSAVVVSKYAVRSPRARARAIARACSSLRSAPLALRRHRERAQEDVLAVGLERDAAHERPFGARDEEELPRRADVRARKPERHEEGADRGQIRGRGVLVAHVPRRNAALRPCNRHRPPPGRLGIRAM